ncbi:FecR family protein [Chitinophaga japonensis]|uniref:FecR family protein n=1 Tax=Chitinophaga japonensis TaxID=104662 RepID=A0A562SRS2_CHIJA|nr:FecR domain-containing protein [Chitinophaga japonensis]TWI83957.1 FecR family protein [Chitinophaga japonensis]
MEYTQEHIYELLLRKKKGGIDHPDDQYLEQLMEEDEAVSRLWEDIREHDFDENVWYEIADSEAAWEKVAPELLRTRRRIVRLSVKKWLVAACTIGIIGTGIYFLLTPPAGNFANLTEENAARAKGLRLQMANGKTIQLPYNSPAQQITTGNMALNAGARTLQYSGEDYGLSGYNTLVVPPRMDYRIILSDGTEVWLNATSTLKFPFNFRENRREVYLEGEGYFKVARNAEKPFIVHTPQTDVEVLGTEFNINTYKAGITSTALVSGAVSARSGASVIELRPGQEAVYTKRLGFTVQQFDKDMVLSWMNGVFQFDNTRLGDLAPVIKRWFGVKVEFDDPALANSLFTGVLDKHHELDFFLKNLKNTGFGVDYYFSGETLHLRSAAQ